MSTSIKSGVHHLSILEKFIHAKANNDKIQEIGILKTPFGDKPYRLKVVSAPKGFSDAVRHPGNAVSFVGSKLHSAEISVLKRLGLAVKEEDGVENRAHRFFEKTVKKADEHYQRIAHLLPLLPTYDTEVTKKLFNPEFHVTQQKHSELKEGFEKAESSLKQQLEDVRHELATTKTSLESLLKGNKKNSKQLKHNKKNQKTGLDESKKTDEKSTASPDNTKEKEKKPAQRKSLSLANFNLFKSKSKSEPKATN